jgi:hypothetical protein
MRSMKSSERVKMMNGRRTIALLAVVLGVACVANAIVAPILGPVTTSTSFSGTAGRNINVSVTSSVWNYSDYLSLNPSMQIATGKYIYEYVVTNLATSNVSISMFQVPIAGPTLINGIATVAGVAGSLNAVPYIVDQDSLPSATYLFMPTALGVNKTSYKLIYSSDGEWTVSTATVAGGSITGDLTQWTPVPEPITALMLGVGGLALLRRKSVR